MAFAHAHYVRTGRGLIYVQAALTRLIEAHADAAGGLDRLCESNIARAAADLRTALAALDEGGSREAAAREVA